MDRGFLPADLPPLLVLTDRTRTGGRPLGEVVGSAVEGGARVVVLREKDLSRDERAGLADEIRPIVQGAGGFFLVAGDGSIESDGVHLAADQRWTDDARQRPILGCSAHRGDDLVPSEDFGFTYVTLSPIFETQSKPGYGPAIGLDGLRQAIVEEWEGEDGPERMRLYALGGIDTSERAAACVEAGADGVAVMGAVMQASDPAPFVRDLLDAMASVRGRAA